MEPGETIQGTQIFQFYGLLVFTDRQIIRIKKTEISKAPLEPGETIKKTLDFIGVFLFTERRLIYINDSVKVFDFKDKPRTEVTAEKKCLFTKYEFKISTGSEELKIKIGKPPIPEVQELTDLIAARAV